MRLGGPNSALANLPPWGSVGYRAVNEAANRRLLKDETLSGALKLDGLTDIEMARRAAGRIDHKAHDGRGGAEALQKNNVLTGAGLRRSPAGTPRMTRPPIRSGAAGFVESAGDAVVSPLDQFDVYAPRAHVVDLRINECGSNPNFLPISAIVACYGRWNTPKLGFWRPDNRWPE